MRSTVLFFLTLFLLSCATSHTVIETSSDKPEKMEFYETPLVQLDSAQVLFRATKDNKNGWMNTLGEWVIPPVYDADINSYWKEGMLITRKDGKYGVLNSNNEVVIPFELSAPPYSINNGLIAIQKEDGNYGDCKYYSKKGVYIGEFNNPTPEFRNGLALLTSNRKRLAAYQRTNLRNPNSSITEISTSDFAIINTDFDTVLHFENAPFLVEIGSLHGNRRAFILHPNLGRHANRGITQGLYGYLDKNGKIVVEPRFDAVYKLGAYPQRYPWTPDFPFSTNRALLEYAEHQYGFIDSVGNRVIDLEFIDGKIASVSHFNDGGIAAVRSFSSSKGSSVITLIDTTGKILFQSNEKDAYMGLGNIETTAKNDIIPINNRTENELRLYTSSFDHIVSLSTRDSIYRYNYSEGIGTPQGDDKVFYLIQQRSSISPSATMQKRIISSTGAAITSWIDSRSILSHRFGVFSEYDSTENVLRMFDFSRNELFSCTSCTPVLHDYALNNSGVFKIYHRESDTYSYINYKGTILSELFTDLSKNNLVSLDVQRELYEKEKDIKVELDGDTLLQLFKNSKLFDRIARPKK